MKRESMSKGFKFVLSRAPLKFFSVLLISIVFLGYSSSNADSSAKNSTSHWNQEEFMTFMTEGPGEELLLSGWNRYDGVTIFDDYPCIFSTAGCDEELRQKSLKKAFQTTSDPEFYCEWACQGRARSFGYAHFPVTEVWKKLTAVLGDPESKPYCPQFSGHYGYTSCKGDMPDPIIVPLEDYDWTPEDRASVIEGCVYPILESGWRRFPSLHHWPIVWDRSDVDRLAGSYACYICANGHWNFGWTEYSDYGNGQNHYRLRTQLREDLMSDYGEPRGSLPPLCPDFYGMIRDEYLP